MRQVPYPWNSVEVAEADREITVRVWGREMVQRASLFPVSLKTQGRELLASPIRLCAMANGETLEGSWEEGCYLLTDGGDYATVNGYAQSSCLIANSSIRWEYDGGATWDLEIMPRGMTVPQIFGLEPCPVKRWSLEQLVLEIPLRKDAASMYVTWPAGDILSKKEDRHLEANGRIPEGGMVMPFRPALFFCTEDIGFQLTCDSDRTWQPAHEKEAIEVVDAGDHWLLRLHLLDSLPESWNAEDMNSPAVHFSFGMILTPVKPADSTFLTIHAVHIDCFSKIEGDYWPYLNRSVTDDGTKKVIDRLAEAGVNLLILHEKWNRIQNCWEIAESTRRDMHCLVRMCHQRGIRVIPYFGYEISSSMPGFSSVQETWSWMGTDREGCRSGWYRVPYQRANRACNQSQWADRFAEGVLKCLDEFEFDGVYLDSTAQPEGCTNAAHGCGYTDAKGRRHPTYPIAATRRLMQRICTEVHARHGLVNPHPSGATLPYVTSGSDFLWDGEHIQTAIWKSGLKRFSLDYFRAEYLGKNMGIPVQFIVYEVKDVWTFDMALSLCLIHGVYPRPNAIGHPLDVMEKIWKITDRFGIADAAFVGYWDTQALQADQAAVRVSCYVREQLDGKRRMLIITGNPSPECVGPTRILLPEDAGEVLSVWDAARGKPMETLAFPSLPAYGVEIVEAVLAHREDR
ncbi:MAG: hypothetical protein IJ246_05935 [Clostridia bacterium]|nr:hypothetical protein [Clostridia bacterium]